MIIFKQFYTCHDTFIYMHHMTTDIDDVNQFFLYIFESVYPPKL